MREELGHRSQLVSALINGAKRRRRLPPFPGLEFVQKNHHPGVSSSSAGMGGAGGSLSWERFGYQLEH